MEDMRASMSAVDDSQASASEAGDDLLEVLTELLAKHKEMTGRWLPAKELKEDLNSWLSLRTYAVPQGLRNVIQSTFALHRRLCSSAAYARSLGFKQRERQRRHEYWFELPEVQS